MIIWVILWLAAGAFSYEPIRWANRELDMFSTEDPEPPATIGGLFVCTIFGAASTALLAWLTLGFCITWLISRKIWRIEL